MRNFFRSILCYGVWYCGLALVLVHLSGYAQTLPSGLDITDGRSELTKILGGRTPAVPEGEMFFEGPINPDEYIVGPGDKLSLVLWQPTFTEFPLVVSGEGNVTVPYVGLVKVADLTLTDARTQIQSQVGRVMRSATSTVTLLQPRRFRVHVTGLVENPGSYVISATARVSDAVVLAGGFKRERTFARGDTSSRVLGSQRFVELSDMHNASLGHADLMLFYRAGSATWNPHVRDGETIHVRYATDGDRPIGIFGAVNAPGLFEYVPGDRVSDILSLCGGMAPAADSSKIRLVSENGSNQEFDIRGTSLEAGFGRTLAPGDRVYVGACPDTSRLGSVTVRGEVARPGGFPIVAGVTTLRELLAEAGGLLPTAAAASARLIRQPATDPVDPEKTRIETASQLRMPQLGPASADMLLLAQFSRWNYGTVVVDVTDASGANSEAGNLKLHDGDVLEVPKSPMGVRVIGFVNHGGEVEWQPGQDLDHYLAMAGGVNSGGWKGRTTVVKARNNSQIRYQPSLPIDPGDVIVVPGKPEHSNWDIAKDVVAVTAQVVTVALILQNITKK